MAEEIKDTVNVSVATPPDSAILCRALNSSASFDGAADARFMWMPAGRAKELHLTYDDKPAQVFIDVCSGDEKTVQASFDSLCTKAHPQKPFCDIEHRRTEASAWPQGFEWANQGERDGIYVRAEWSGLGKEHVEKKIHRSFSPSFKTDAVWSWDKDNQRYFCAAGARGSRENPARITGVGFDVGTLTNQPAFKDMQPLFAKENVAAINHQPDNGGTAAAQGVTMTPEELAAKNTADQKKIDDALARASTAEAALIKRDEEAVEGAIVRAVGRKAIEPKDETIRAKALERLKKGAPAEMLVETIDALPAKETPGTTRAVAHTDEKVTRGVEYVESSFEEDFKGWTLQMAPQNKLIREGNIKEAMKLSRASAVVFRGFERKIAAGGDASMPDMITRAADVTTVVDANFGTLSGLLLVLQRNLGFLKNKLIAVDKITTDFRNEPVLFNQWVRTRYFGVPTVVDYTAPTFTGTTPSTTETAKSVATATDVDVKIDKNKRVWVPIDTAILAGTARNLIQEQRSPAIYALAEQMNTDLITTILNGTVQAGGNTVTFTTTPATLSVADAKDVQTWLPAVGLKADVAKMPDMGGRYLLMHSAYYRAMQSDKNFALLEGIANSQRANPLLFGDINMPYGFQIYSSQLMRSNANYLAATTLGFCGTKESLIFVGRVPQDYTQAIEAPATASIQILTEPETGLSIMVAQFVNNNLETANIRVAIMYGTAIGHPGMGFLINQS